MANTGPNRHPNEISLFTLGELEIHNKIFQMNLWNGKRKCK